MKTEKVIWGLTLVFVGVLLLLQNLGYINFYWPVIFRFWPIILILVGANLLFSRDESIASKVSLILLTMLALGFIAYKGITTSSENSHWSFNYNDDDNNDDEDNHGEDDASTSNVFTEEYNESISRATLNISGGATQYILNDTTSTLFHADVKKSFGNYSLLRTSTDSAEVLNFSMKGKSNWKLHGNHHGNKVELKLNTNPIWDINIEMGAGTTKFDLSPFKINNLNIEGGAASFKIKLGQPAQITRVSVETGVSEIEISIPENVACKIDVESGLSSNDFEGFTKQADGTYTTGNYSGAPKAIVLNLESGLSKFKVTRY